MLVKKPEPHGILNKTQMEFLTRFNQLPDSSAFYLTGGTALAEFYLGHRLSYDLDLFTTVAGLIRPFCLFMESAMEQQGFSLRAVRRMESFTEYEVALGHDTLRIHLAYDSPFRFAEPAPTPFGLVNDFQDIVVDKLLAFFGRAEPRDAVDLYFILQDVDFWELADMASQKDTGFDLYWMASALMKVTTFPDEAERWPVQMLRPFEPTALKREFTEFSQQILSRIRR
ncbi:MAG: hypothetical protein KatS3mg023_1891 [Armatimonadota bacterium]|nr:MAG: hypothetical protein KatS3mg023_1891 [Armatimonadota bacterium]